MTIYQDAALRAEMQAAIQALVPGLRGLQELASITTLSSSARMAITDQIDRRGRRTDLLKAVLSALDALDAAGAALAVDGYPDMPKIQIFGPVFDEIQGHSGDIATAVALFEAENIAAAKLSISLGTPVGKL
jgi:hypothetical protein